MKESIEKIKTFVKNNQQKVILFGSVALVMLIIIIAISVTMKMINNKITYQELEIKLEEAAYQYLQEHPNELPNETNPTILSANTLIENKHIKKLEKYVKDTSCSAIVQIDYMENSYNYQTYLTCDTYKTENLLDVIKSKTDKSQTGDGLYEMNNELVFRGEDPNNYVQFADELWRIVKIDKDNRIKIILTETKDTDIYGTWDNRYNSEKQSTYGINNYALSRALLKTNEIYDLKYNSLSKYLTRYDLCVGKRLEESVEKNGNLECNETLKDQMIGLLPIYDFMNASLDALCTTSTSRECQNYNYLTNMKSKWWTMTANLNDTYSAFFVSYSGVVSSDYTSSNSILRYVLALNSRVLYASGEGTKENPYVIR